MKLLLRLFITFCAFFSTELFAGSLKVNLAPAAAVTAGARWQVDGGSWKTSGTTVNNLSNTAHPVGFKAIAGWITPAAVNATITNGTTTTLNITYVQAASLKITLTPSSGTWRIDGGTWRSSGTTVAGLTPGNHTIDYSSLSGYLSPASETISLTSGLTTTVARSYIRPSSLKLTLAPTNAQWRVDGGAWNVSGATVANLTPGSHLVDYASLAGYTAPVSESATLVSGQTLSLSRSYIQLAQVSVTLTPATGQWNVDGGAWQSSGVSVANLTVGSHTINYSALSNYTSPASESVSLAAGQTLALSRSYTPLAQISIYLVPAAGQWRTNGGAWQPSGASLFVIPGNQLIEYATLADFDSPASESITLAAGGSFTTTRTYITTRPSLRINLTPGSGQWRIDNGDWQAAGSLVTGLTPGTHSVDYTDIGGAYNPLPSESVSLDLRENATLDRSYPIKPPASLTITLDPSSAQWRVDGGAWQASEATVNELAYDVAHTIEYESVIGYIAPASETVTPTSGQNVTLSRSYTPLASFSVVLNPSSAEWRFVGSGGNSPWFSSGTIVPSLPLGAHTIEFSDVTGFITPAVENVTLVSGPNPTLNKSYVPLASFGVTLDPTSAEWRFVGSGGNSPWFSSGAILPNLPLGTHTIEFSSLTGFITPATETVELVSGINPTIFRNYTPLASLDVNLSQSPAEAQWRIDGGAWNYGATILNNISIGTHLIEYSEVIGYITPSSETITLVSGPNSHNAPTYVQLASLYVQLYTPNAQWRIDGGAWNGGATVLNYLSLGQHTIEYSDAIGYITPASESITLASGANSHIAPTYTQLASLYVQLYTPNAQWRIDGGAWNGGATILNCLSLGQHTIEYSDAIGYITPTSESITLVSGPNTHIAPTYVQLASLNVYLPTSGTQWRIDGGAWNYGAAFLYNLSLGTHLIEYSDVIGYITPVSEPITLTSGPNSHNAPSYTQLASLNVYLPTSGAQWRIDGGAWNYGATFLYNLSLGTHLIEYSDVIGYITPGSEPITLVSGPNSHNAPSYTQLASLNVYLPTPGAQWRIDGGNWNYGAAFLYNLSLGTHLIEYSDVYGYSTPSSETIVLVSGPNSHNAPSYIQDAAISVYLDLGFAQWRVDGGDWNTSGSYVNNLSIGTHAIEYSQHEGYTSPTSDSVTLVGGYNPGLSRSYTAIPTFYADPALATLNVSLLPTFAEWRLDGGNWNTSGAFLHNLSLGAHSIEYSTVGGYITPSSDFVTLHSGYNSYATSLTELAILNVYLEPAQGQWRVDGGAWHDRNAVVGSLTLGSHTVEYAPVAGYATPQAESVTLISGLNPSLFRSYASLTPAQITITTNPASGQWRIYPQQASPTGEWKASGATVTSLNPGSYSVEYAPVAGYTLPSNTYVELLPNDHQMINATYAPIPAQFKIILFPHAGKYRINGGAWNSSGSTTMGAAPGNYLIEFQDLAGYPTPAPTTITLNPGDVKEFVYGYGPLPPPTLTFNLTPSTGLWRVDGGSWNASGTTVTNLTVGSHSVEFSPLSGYLTPTTTNVQLTEAEEKILSKNYYVGSATLKVYLNPTNGRWRMDGGTWIPSSWIIYFGSGPHLIEFEPLPGRITPPSENLFLEVNENRVITRNYQ